MSTRTFKQPAEVIRLTYASTGSIRQTARVLGIAHSTVRKTLINMGLYSNDLSNAINTLQRKGMNRAEIAEALHISASAVDANSPYSRGTYLDADKTLNAKRISNSRKRHGKEG